MGEKEEVYISLFFKSNFLPESGGFDGECDNLFLRILIFRVCVVVLKQVT